MTAQLGTGRVPFAIGATTGGRRGGGAAGERVEASASTPPIRTTARASLGTSATATRRSNSRSRCRGGSSRARSPEPSAQARSRACASRARMARGSRQPRRRRRNQRRGRARSNSKARLYDVINAGECCVVIVVNYSSNILLCARDRCPPQGTPVDCRVSGGRP